ncbi:MAG: hypothetical protein FJ278_03100 [Planctomycetes bacterium]|nr:hypothetical protein [Planctomycetota bacterium]
MGRIRRGKLEIDPTRNPAVLDAATWDAAAAWAVVRAVPEPFWQSAAGGKVRVYPGSRVRHGQSEYALVGLPDGQHVLIQFGPSDVPPPLGQPIGEKTANGTRQAAYATDAATLDRFCRLVCPPKGPRALGATPRLGIGCRMSAAIWPGVWPAMEKGRFAANAIQNSLRELNLLDDLCAGRPARSNYMFGFGRLDEGHTGSTFEGLWVYGLLEALKSGTCPRYGADADHIMVKRTPDGLERAKQVIAAARYYTFFTLDVSDILDYGAMSAAAKYSAALNAVEELVEHIRRLKEGVPFDLELSIDESPPGVPTFETVTTETELAFLLGEIERRRLPITHVAPNLGVEKGSDYRCPDGLEGLERRTRALHRMLNERGLMLDCHSGDDLSPATRRVVGRATDGVNHFKISPCLQVLFGETLNGLYPEEFRFWWDDTMAYAAREADGGAKFAAQCIHEYEAAERRVPSPRHSVFHHFCFATVGRRDADGQFIHRERFYSLPPAFYQEYHRRVERLLCEVAADVFSVAP